AGHATCGDAAAHNTPHRHGKGSGRGGEVVGVPEGAVAVAQQHTHTTIEEIRSRANAHHGEVLAAVAVKIAHCHGTGPRPGGEGAVALEGTAALAQQHAHTIPGGRR